MDLTSIFVLLGAGAFMWYVYKLYRKDEFISLSSVRKNPQQNRIHGQLDVNRGYYYVDERKKKK